MKADEGKLSDWVIARLMLVLGVIAFVVAVLVPCGCTVQAHLFEAPAADAQRKDWEKQVTDMLNDHDQRLQNLEDKAADGGRT